MSGKNSISLIQNKHGDLREEIIELSSKDAELDLDLRALNINESDGVNTRINNKMSDNADHTEEVESLKNPNQINEPNDDKHLDRTNNTNKKESSGDSHPGLSSEIQLSFSPLDNYTSVIKFEDMGLRKEIILGIYDVGFQRPSKIQEKALPLLLSEKHQNLIGQSQSGTGKTATFTIAALSRVDENLKCTQVVCVSPSRELARQTMDFIENISKYTKITLGLAVKDLERSNEVINKHLVVGTPGTLVGLIVRRKLDVSSLKVFVVDEADHVLGEQNMGGQTLRIRRYAPKNCQIIFLSATYPKKLIDYATRLAPDAHRISLKEEELSVEGITQLYMICNDYAHKYKVLSAIYGLLTVGQSMVFCQRRDTAERVGQRLKLDGHVCEVIHGGFPSEVRDTIIDKFRNGEVKVLICSNVISRGLDIEQVNVVINFDIPLDLVGAPDPETYLHRIGRTGRFGRSGISIMFVHDDNSMRDMEFIMNHFGKQIVKIDTQSLPELEIKLRNILGLEA